LERQMPVFSAEEHPYEEWKEALENTADFEH
jgi:hypothetical protein